MCERAPTALQDLIIPSKEIESFSKGILLLMGENYEFEKDKLIQLLIAEGFIENEPMEINGTKYFEDFVSKGYILYSDSNSLYRANIEKVKSDLDMINYLRLEITSRKNAATAETLHVSVVGDGMNDAVLNTLSKCYRLRTLLFLGAYSGRPEKMLVDLFLRFKSLVVLDLSGTDIKELPSSTVKMINLRYLDLSWTSIEILPEAICHFEELQTLRLEGCSHLWRLPRDFKRLTKLRHLYFDVLGQLAVIPKGMGALVNLRTLSAFIVDTQEGCKITELQNLDNLTGEFCIARLEHVQSAVDARLASLSAKKHLKKLELRWSDSSLQEAEGDDIRNDVLENLRPHSDLEELHIQFYCGTSLAGWIADEAFQKLASVTLYKCEHLSVLPSMQKLPSLEYLRLFSLIRVTKMDFIYGGSAFPKLRTLVIENILSLKTWAEAVKGDFPCLVELTIKDCPNLPELPSLVYLSSMKRLEISRCPKVQFVPNKKLSTLLEFLMVEDCPLIEESYSNQRDQFLDKMKHVPNIWIGHDDSSEQLGDDDSELLDDDGSELDDDDSELLDDEHWTYGSDNHTEETYQDD